MRPSKIEELNLQSQFLPIYHKTNRNISETARQLSKIAGVEISNMAVKRYINSFERIKKITLPKKPDTVEAVVGYFTQDKGKTEAVNFKFEEDGLEIYEHIRNDPNKTDEEKLEALDLVKNKIFARALDHHGIGVKASTQVNIQNNIIIEETLDRIAEVLKRKVNGDSDSIISELRSGIRVCSE